MRIGGLGAVSKKQQSISGAGFVRAVQEAHAARKKLVVVTDRDQFGQIVRIGYYLQPSATETPEITWFRDDEIEIREVPAAPQHFSDARLEVGFEHPKEQERHLLLNIPAGEDQTIILRVLFRMHDNGVAAFVIQAEVRGRISGKLEWKPVVRYDCAHGYIHRDLLAFDGTKFKEPIPVTDLATAVPLAMREIREHLAEWLVELGYDQPDARNLGDPSIGEELESAQQTLLRLLENPQSIEDVSSRSVMFQDYTPGVPDQ